MKIIYKFLFKNQCILILELNAKLLPWLLKPIMIWPLLVSQSSSQITVHLFFFTPGSWVFFSFWNMPSCYHLGHFPPHDLLSQEHSSSCFSHSGPFVLTTIKLPTLNHYHFILLYFLYDSYHFLKFLLVVMFTSSIVFPHQNKRSKSYEQNKFCPVLRRILIKNN